MVSGWLINSSCVCIVSLDLRPSVPYYYYPLSLYPATNLELDKDIQLYLTPDKLAELFQVHISGESPNITFNYTNYFVEHTNQTQAVRNPYSDPLAHVVVYLYPSNFCASVLSPICEMPNV